MKQRKIPMRMCVVTREKHPKKDLIRIVMTENGLIADLSGKVNGHGVYLKKDKEVIKKAKEKKILDKLFETKVSEELYEKINELI